MSLTIHETLEKHQTETSEIITFLERQVLIMQQEIRKLKNRRDRKRHAV